MSRIIRTVSLCKKSDELAGLKPNFSRWVRDQLISSDETSSNSHVTLAVFRERGICNPSASPRCAICFPYGRPQMVDVRQWNHEHNYVNSEGQHTLKIGANERLQEITKKKFKKDDTKSLLDISNIQNDGKETNVDELIIPERKYLRRAVRWALNFI